MQPESKTDLAEPCEVRSSIWRLVGLQRPKRREVGDTLAIPGETVLQVRDKLGRSYVALPSRLGYWIEQLIA